MLYLSLSLSSEPNQLNSFFQLTNTKKSGQLKAELKGLGQKKAMMGHTENEVRYAKITEIIWQ